jgi:hypothetical protein
MLSSTERVIQGRPTARPSSLGENEYSELKKGQSATDGSRRVSRLSSILKSDGILIL